MRGVDLAVRRGEIVAIMGRNGAGKSTLLASLAGARRPLSGTVAIEGGVGLVPQEPGDLLWAQTVAAECRDADRDAHVAAGTVRALLTDLAPDIDDDQHPRDLSEGQRLSLVLAIVLAARPALLALDEPTRGLDYATKRRLVAVLRRLAAAGHGVAARHPRRRAGRRGRRPDGGDRRRRDRQRRPRARGRGVVAGVRPAGGESVGTTAVPDRRGCRRRPGGHPMSAVTAIRLRPRSAAALFAATVVGVVGFGWPLLDARLAGASASTAHASDAPWLFIGLLSLLLAVVLAEVSEGGIDAKAVAVLGVLAGCGAALRPLSGGATGFSFVFFLLIPAGRVLGRNFGFVLGAVTLLASALLTGQVGPWLPFEMLGCAWTGYGAAACPRRAAGSRSRSWRGTARCPGCSTGCCSTCPTGRSRSTCHRRSRSCPADRSARTSRWVRFDLTTSPCSSLVPSVSTVLTLKESPEERDAGPLRQLALLGDETGGGQESLLAWCESHGCYRRFLFVYEEC